MKIDRIDVCHETIQDETNESIVVSVVETENEEEFAIRFHLNYHEELSPLIGLCVEEMNNTTQAREFFLKVVDQYYEQF
tara:strand:+ start:4301 stop:4537 length:237 start_codon:yes stop_codon:yes gene_type:complete